MARKANNTMNLIEIFTEFKETKNVDRATLVGVLEESFHNALARMFGSDENFDIIINPDKGDCEIYRTRVVVEDGAVTDENREIPLSEAQQIEEDYEVGEEVSESINFANFGRRAILTLRQTLQSKLLELEHDTLYNKYKERIGEVVAAEVYQTWKSGTLLVDDEGNDLNMPKDEQIPGDYHHKGDLVRAVVKSVEMVNGTPRIVVSRTDNNFLLRLLEQEVPEIADGLITIRGVARIPGEKAKIAVESYDERIDPVGACVGVRGRRVHGIVRELRNENIDVITYTTNTELFIQRALAPAKILNINIDEEKRTVEAHMRPSEVSLAIGRGGTNIKLASMLTGYTIEVFRDDDNNEIDYDLDEFDDEIEGWILDAFKKCGMDTARRVIETPRERLIEIVDLEEETIDNVLRILNEEFERAVE